MIQNKENKKYKRQTREVPKIVRDKISASLRGRKKSISHCMAISNALKAETGGYWSKIPKSNNDDLQ
jgi:hypothetical protein